MILKTEIINIVNFYKKYPQYKGKIKVKTPYGYNKIEEAAKTDFSSPCIIKTQNKELKCSLGHRLKTQSFIKKDQFNKRPHTIDTWTNVDDINIGTKIKTIDGFETVTEKIQLNNSESLYDLQVEDVKQYYSNGILSHNSTIFCDAILWGLFDKTVKDVKKPSLPHRLRGKNCHVRIKFSLGDRKFTVFNSIKPNDFILTEHLDSEDVHLSKSSKPETIKYITEELLKSSYLMFRNCLVLSITNNTNIFEMNKSEKRDFLETMMDYAVIGDMFMNSKKDRNKVDSELTLKRQDAMRIEESLNDFKTKQKDFNRLKKAKISEIQGEIDLLKNKLDGLVIDPKNYVEKRDMLKEAKKNILKTIDKINEEKTNASNEILIVKGEIDNFDSIRKKYSKVLDCLCDKCKTTADGILGLEDNDSMIERQKKIEEARKKVISLTEKIQTIKDDKLKKITENIDILDERIYNVDRDIQKKETLDVSIGIKEKQLADENDRKSDFESLIDKNSKELEIINENISKLSEEKKYLDYIVLLTSEEGIRKNLLSEYISLLNARIRSYLDEMSCGYTLILDDEFNYTFLTTSGECEYDSFSAGEKVTLISACMFAFRDLLFGQGTLQSNLFICDEILDTSLDDISLNNIINILKKVSEEQNVFLISHRECVTPDDFNNVIKIEKENEYTTIVENKE